VDLDLDGERYHLASDDYEELWDAILEHPSPEKALDGDPYQPYRSRYRLKRSGSAGTSLPSSVTGDSWQGHEELNAVPGPMPSVDFIPYEPGVMCSYCNQRPAECTVNGSALCLYDAENRWGIPIAEVPESGEAMDFESTDDDDPYEDIPDDIGLGPHEGSNTNHERSAMVSLDLPPGVLSSTEDPPHVTVVYLGKGLEGPRIEQIAQRLSQLAAGTPGPLEGTVGGLGTFVPSASSDWKTPVFAVPEVEGLSDLRAHLEDLNASEHTDFHPHITLKYLDQGEPLPAEPEPIPVSFTHLTLHHGDDVRHFPFAGKLGAKKAPGYHTDKFYHGSAHDFEPGDEVHSGLNPAHHPGVSNDVWVADNAWVGSTYGHNTYEVTPHGPPKKTGKSGEFTTSGATVVRKVPNAEILEHANRWYDPKWRPAHEAAWRDVMDKAKRLRETNAVRLLETPTPGSPYVFAEVKGDNATHHCFVAVKGNEQGQWSCSCPWGDFGPNGPLAEDRASGSPYKKTPCSHILATRWELQSRSMFGRNPYVGALKEGSMDFLDDWFAGRFLVEARETPTGTGPEGRLAPHKTLEGTPLPTVGRPGFFKRNDRATHFEDLPQGHQDMVRQHFANNFSDEHGQPMTHERMTQNVEDMFHDAKQSDDMEGTNYVKGGGKWYHQAHKQIGDWAKKYGVHPHQLAGAAASLSPSTDWDSNLAMTHYFARHLGDNATEKDKKLDLDTSKFTPRQTASYNAKPDKPSRGNPEQLSHAEVAQKYGFKHGDSFADMKDPTAVAHALHQQQHYTHHVRKDFGGSMVEEPHKGSSWQSADNASKAVSMIRGGDPDKSLSGSKVRSFFNNIRWPRHGDDVTVDSHAASMILGSKMGASSQHLKMAQELQGAPEETRPIRTSLHEEHNTSGGYAYMASAVRKAHSNLVAQGHMSKDSTPADLQAITWKRWRDRMPAEKSGEEKLTPSLYTPKGTYPTLSHLVMAADDDAPTDDGDPYDEDNYDPLDPYGGPDEPDPDLYPYGDEENVCPGDDEDNDYADMLTDRRKEGAMYDWTNMLRQAHRQAREAEAQVAQLRPVEVPVQYLGQVPHHLASGMDEFGFEPHQAIAAPSEDWQRQHSPGAPNPADTAPEGFGEVLDPMFKRHRPYPDERLLEPGGVVTTPLTSPGFAVGYDLVTASVTVQADYQAPMDPAPVYPTTPLPSYPMVQAPASQPLAQPVPTEASGADQVLAEHQAGLEWLRPPGGAPGGLPGASPAMSRDALLAQHTADKAQLAAGAEAFLRTGSIPVAGMEVNMDTILSMPAGSLSGMEHDARSRDFTPAEQDEMVREGELEGVKASNLHMLRLQGSMYEELERQLSSDDQSQAAANALWW
jgi:2'-5' RNA ligase